MADAAQPLLDNFYALDNLVTVEIVMKDADWTTLANTPAAWGWRRMATIPQARDDIPPKYNYFDTTSVAISGSKYPPRTSVPFVGIIKKSFAGSEWNLKPSIRLHFGRSPSGASKTDSDAAKQTKNTIDNLIGTHHMTLNNCKQDSSYIRQPLGYQVLRQGAIPAARCNFARVIVRGTSQGPTDKSLFSGVYVNLEQPREPYLRRNFANNDKGNLYETELGFDLNPKYFATPLFNANDPAYIPATKDQRKNYDYNGVSQYTDQKDLYLAASELTKCVANKDLTTAKNLVDWNQLLQVTAMQTLVQHWDGYPNNTLVYNDVTAVAEPTVANIKLKLIPSGIDAILQGSTRPFKVKNEGLLSNLVFMTDDTTKQLKTTLQTCAATFATNLAANMKLIDGMETLLLGVLTDSDIPTAKVSASQEISKVRDAMNNVKNGMADLLSDANWPRMTFKDESWFENQGY
jgi:hypothetical protein